MPKFDLNSTSRCRRRIDIIDPAFAATGKSIIAPIELKSIPEYSGCKQWGNNFMAIDISR